MNWLRKPRTAHTTSADEALRNELLHVDFLKEIEGLKLEFRRWRSGEGSGDLSSRRPGESALFREHRGYVAGDDPRRIDWNAWLRLGDLLTRTTEAEESPRLSLVLDRSPSMTLWDGGKRRAAARIAGAIGTLALLRGATLSLAPYPLTHRPALYRGRHQLQAFLKDLVQPSTPSATTSRNRGPLLFLSDCLDPEGLPQSLRLLSRGHSQTHILQIEDARDFDLPLHEPFRLQDIESGASLRLTPSPSLLTAYRKELTTHLQSLRSAALTSGHLWHTIPLTTPLPAILTSLLRSGLT